MAVDCSALAELAHPAIKNNSLIALPLDVFMSHPVIVTACCMPHNNCDIHTRSIASVLVSFLIRPMGRKRFAIITFDPDKVEKLSWQGEGNSLAWIVWRGLCGWTYPKERGIINITLMAQLPAKPHPSEDLLE